MYMEACFFQQQQQKKKKLKKGKCDLTSYLTVLSLFQAIPSL